MQITGISLSRGIVLMLLSSLGFGVMLAFAKLSSQELPPLEVVFFRNLLGIVLIYFTFFKKPLRNKGGKPLLLIFRGVVGFIAMVAFFYNVAHIPLGDAQTYAKTSPIFTALFAFLLLKERLRPLTWAAIVIGFVGIVFITKPDGLFIDKHALLGLLTGVGAALAYTAVRELNSYYDTRSIVLSFMISGTVGPVILFIVSQYVYSETFDFLFATFVMPTFETCFYLVGMGISATVAQLLMTKAYAIEKAGVVATIGYTSIAFALLVGALLGDALPDTSTFIGIVLIVISGIAVSRDKESK